ncbi:hypothetical protein BGZ46_001490 [Entomortierella lignicola]|nr:hypothetical protein BGZ46_001490 [Entomortierella lignicola]
MTSYDNTKKENIEEELATQYESNGLSERVTFDEKRDRKPRMSIGNPIKAVSKGVAQGSQAVLGGISQVEQGVNNVGNTLNKVPGVKHGVSFFADYRKFMDRGNVIDLAVAVVIGAAFTSIVTSLVTDIITPILALASGKNLEENFLILRRNETAGYVTEVTEKSCDYCGKKVPIKSVRCPMCTTWLDWDVCTKVANMERIAATGGFRPPVDTPPTDYPHSSLDRF